jgi:hypothetical protein
MSSRRFVTAAIRHFQAGAAADNLAARPADEGC